MTDITKRFCKTCAGKGFLENPMRQCGVCLSTGLNKAARARRAANEKVAAARERKRLRHERRILDGEIDGKDNL